MYNLFLDTANKNIHMAIFTDKKKIIYKHTILNVIKMSEIIINEIKFFLKKYDIKNEEIKKIYLTIGPGSFNGVRIASIIAKTWVLIYPKCKTYVINSLRLLAINKQSISILDLNKNKKCVGVFNNLKNEENYFVLTNNETNKLISKKTNYIVCNNYVNENIYNCLISNLEYFKEINPNYIEPAYLQDDFLKKHK